MIVVHVGAVPSGPDSPKLVAVISPTVQTEMAERLRTYFDRLNDKLVQDLSETTQEPRPEE